jgi:hypothetical protein
MFKKILIASLVATAFTAAPAISTAQQRAIVITQPPPPPREDRPHDMRRGYEWAPGHWAWRNGQHVWVEGRYMRERRGSHWVPDRWVERNGRWEMVAGHWQRGNRRGDGPGMNRDRDGDGVPNRMDSRPNNPNRN